MSQATGFSRAFAFFLSGFQGFSSKMHSERFSSSGLPMGTPDETWGVNSLTIAVVNCGYGSHKVAGGQSHVRTVAGTVGEFLEMVLPQVE